MPPFIYYYITFVNKTIAEWVSRNVSGPRADDCAAVGVDVTWRPCAEPIAGQIALIQIATRRATLVLHVAMFEANTFSAATLRAKVPNLYAVLCDDALVDGGDSRGGSIGGSGAGGGMAGEFILCTVLPLVRILMISACHVIISLS